MDLKLKVFLRPLVYLSLFVIMFISTSFHLLPNIYLVAILLQNNFDLKKLNFFRFIACS